MKIAVSGKGGVGKTTISAALVNFFLNQGYKVFAVDADPDVSLGTVLGIDDEQVEGLRPIVDMREVIAKKCGGEGAFYPLNPDVDDIVEEYVIQKGNLYFLKMGAVKQGGSACYCRENTVLNALVNAMLIKHKEIVLLDMGAGIEHLTRGTSSGVDLMVIVTEPSKVSVNTALTVKKLAKELGVKTIGFIGNKIRTDEEKKFLESNLPEEEILGFVPFDDQVLALSMGIYPLENSSAAILNIENVSKSILSKIAD